MYGLEARCRVKCCDLCARGESVVFYYSLSKSESLRVKKSDERIDLICGIAFNCGEHFLSAGNRSSDCGKLAIG